MEPMEPQTPKTETPVVELDVNPEEFSELLELTPEEEKAILEFEPPPFSFLGADGRDYIIGPSPRMFEQEMFKVMDRVGTLGAEVPSIREFIDLWDDWIWMHLIGVPGQHDITREQVTNLYFVVDRPQIMGLIMRRFSEGMAASSQTMNVMAVAGAQWAEGLRQAREAMNADGPSEQSHGEQTVLQHEPVASNSDISPGQD